MLDQRELRSLAEIQDNYFKLRWTTKKSTVQHVVLGVSNSFRFTLALKFTLYIRYNCVNVFLYGQLQTSSSTLRHTTQCKVNLTITCRLKLTLFEWGLVSVEVEAGV